MQPLQRLLAELVDYAGLFPPAALDMDTMSSNYADYARSTNSWMLGRVVVPLGRVPEFVEAYGGPPAKISALPPALDAPEFPAAAETIAKLNRESVHQIDAVEVRTADVGAIKNAGLLPVGVRCFVETPLAETESFVDSIAALNESGGRIFAKVRTGGVKPNMIPSAADVAQFVVACHRKSIGFKATAGLHHPCRATYPLTYEVDSEAARMHGFLNVFLTACFVKRFDLNAIQAAVCIDEIQADGITVTGESITWRDYTIGDETIATTRANFATSFGSCSFTEPTQDLSSLSFLPENPNATS